MASLSTSTVGAGSSPGTARGGFTSGADKVPVATRGRGGACVSPAAFFALVAATGAAGVGVCVTGWLAGALAGRVAAWDTEVSTGAATLGATATVEDAAASGTKGGTAGAGGGVTFACVLLEDAPRK